MQFEFSLMLFDDISSKKLGAVKIQGERLETWTMTEQQNVIPYGGTRRKALAAPHEKHFIFF